MINVLRFLQSPSVRPAMGLGGFAGVPGKTCGGPGGLAGKARASLLSMFCLRACYRTASLFWFRSTKTMLDGFPTGTYCPVNSRPPVWRFTLKTVTWSAR